MRLRVFAAAGALLLGLFSSTPAMAQGGSAPGARPTDQTSALIFVGGSAGHNSGYGYLGGMAPLGSDHFGNGFVVKPWVDYTSYTFQSNGTNVTGSSPGAEVLFGYTGGSEDGYWGIYVGPRWENTTFSPGLTPAPQFSGSTFGAKGEVIGMARVSDLVALEGIASYTTNDEFHWIRGRLLVGNKDGVAVGPEVVVMGNPTFEGRQYGLAVTNIALTENTSIGLHGGYSTTRGLVGASSTEGGGYGGVDLTFRL